MRCKMTVVKGILLVVILVGLVPLFGQSLYPPVSPGQEVRVKGVLIHHWGKEATMGLTADDLEQLTYGVDEILGYTVVPNPDNGNHTVINLDGGGETKPAKWLKSSIIRAWSNQEQAQRYKQRLVEFPRLYDSGIVIEVDVYDRPAKDYGATLSEYRWKSSAGIRFREGTPSGLPLGEESWYLPPRTQFFRLGRCFVRVSAPGSILAEGLAAGIEYRIRQHPKRLLASASQPTTLLVSNQPVAAGQTISLGGVVVAPLSVFQSAKARMHPQRTDKDWTMKVSLKDKWVQVKALGAEMETSKGPVKLKRPAFPYKDELIVPLEQIAEALGMKMQQQGKTIALLAK